MIYYINAIQSLVPNAQCVVSNNGYENIVWHDERPLPSKELVDAEFTRLQAEYDAKEYQRNRVKEYPSLADFADAYYWAQNGDDTKMTAYIEKCDEVKAKYPKETV
jgi:hypothetical protein